jgi:large subunit ribosomal protein L18
MKSPYERQQFRTLRVRNKIRSAAQHPRLSVYRSLKHIYAQIIDDVQGRTLAFATSKSKATGKVSGIKAATVVGELVAKMAVKNGVTQVVFDRGGRPYHGRVKALAEAAREAGLKF